MTRTTYLHDQITTLTEEWTSRADSLRQNLDFKAATTLDRARREVQTLLARAEMHAVEEPVATRSDGAPIGAFVQFGPTQTRRIVRLYREGWSAERIGAAFGVSAPTILKTLRGAGVTIRPRGRPAKVERPTVKRAA